MPEEQQELTREQKRKNTILVYIDHGKIWPTIKVTDDLPVDVIVVNNDATAIWRPQIRYNCEDEIMEISKLADELGEDVDYVDKFVKKDEIQNGQ